LKKTLTRPHLFAAALALALCTPALPAAAQASAPAAQAVAPPVTAAGIRQLYTSGETKFKALDYAGALTDFQAADSAKPTPQTARYVGICQDKLGHYPEAVAAYERFLIDVPLKLQKEGDEIKKRVDEIKAMPGHLRVNTLPPGAGVTIDGAPPPLSSPVDVDLPAGPHVLHAMAEGHEAADQTVTMTFASKQEVTLQLPEKAPPPPPVVVAAVPVVPLPPPPPPPPPPRSKVPAIVTGGLAIAAAGVGVVFGAITLNDKSNFNKDGLESTAETGQNHALICDMAFGIAITLGVTSVVLLLTHDEADAAKTARAAAPKSFMLTPLVSPHGGGAGAVLRF
jgi:hypothetical protein